MKRLTESERQELIHVQQALTKQMSRGSGYHGKENANFGDKFQESVIPYLSYFKKHPSLQRILKIRPSSYTAIFPDSVTAEQADDLSFYASHRKLALTHHELLNRIEDVLLDDDVLQGDDLSKLDKLLLKLEQKLIKQTELDEATHEKPFEKQNFWGMYEKNVFPYIMFLDNHPSVKHALHVITAENMYQKPFMKGYVFDSRTQQKLTHNDLLKRILLQQENKDF